MSFREPPPFVKRGRRSPGGIPAAGSPACDRASCSCCCPRGCRCCWGRSSRRARGSRAARGRAQGAGRRAGAGPGRGRSGNSLSPRGGGRRGLQLGAGFSALDLRTCLKVRRGGRRGSGSWGGRRPACHGREFARGAGGAADFPGGSGGAASPRPHLPRPQPPP